MKISKMAKLISLTFLTAATLMGCGSDGSASKSGSISVTDPNGVSKIKLYSVDSQGQYAYGFFLSFADGKRTLSKISSITMQSTSGGTTRTLTSGEFSGEKPDADDLASASKLWPNQYDASAVNANAAQEFLLVISVANIAAGNYIFTINFQGSDGSSQSVSDTLNVSSAVHI